MNQAFRPLHISSSDSNLNFSQLSHLYHLQYAFFIIPDLAYIGKDLYASKQDRFKTMYSLLGLDTIG